MERVVSYVVEEVDLVFLQEQGCARSNGRRITPSLVEETSVIVQGVEVCGVCFGSPQLQAGDLKLDQK